jgi:Ca2+-transporting ATPase
LLNASRVSQEVYTTSKKLESFGRKIGVVVIVIALSLFILGVTKEGLWTLLLSGQFSDFFRGALDFFTVAVSLAVAAVPEGLPAIVTITLAIGVTKMVSRQALVRRISSVETLGSTTVICTDKTGTLTKNEMTVKEIFTDGSILKIGGEGYSSKGDLSGERTAAHNLLFRIGALCNNASFSPESERVSGDPTEIALLVSAWKAGIDYRSEQSKWERDSEEPFSSERKMMSVVCRHPETGHPVVL